MICNFIKKLKKRKMKNIGIVLSGGGAKGAFEIGVLEILLDSFKKTNKKLIAISGTSIGAFNGAFVAADQFEELKNIWLNWDEKNCELIRSPFFGPIPSLLTYGYMYENESLIQLLRKKLDLEKLLLKKIKYINTAVRLGDGELVYGGNIGKAYSGKKFEEIAASMALIPGTPGIEIDGKVYGDGGYRDTIPVKGLLDNLEGETLDEIYVIGVDSPIRPWTNKLDKNSPTSVIDKFLFVLWDIFWDENNRSDIEIGRLKYWNSDKYKVITPEKLNLSISDFKKDLISEAYRHGLEIGKKYI